LSDRRLAALDAFDRGDAAFRPMNAGPPESMPGLVPCEAGGGLARD
jgi:hypothetical protein